MSYAYAEAAADAGLVQCAACGFWDETYRMKFNTDGSAWFCSTAADGQPPCAEELSPCATCKTPTPRQELDMDHLCEHCESNARAA